MSIRRKRITGADVAGIVLTLVVAGVAVWLNWATLTSAADTLAEPSAEPSGERAEPEPEHQSPPTCVGSGPAEQSSAHPTGRRPTPRTRA